MSEKTVIHFDGVDNAYFVYINGQQAGFAKGSRNMHEFDISKLVRLGENELYVKVYTYSDASYMEAQDMILASGIFRSVYLIETDDVSVWDYTIKTTMTEIEVSVDVDLKDGYKLLVTVDGQKTSDKEHTFKIENPKLWNCEEPNLYDVTIELYRSGSITERHVKRVGMREVEIIDGRLCINKVPILLKGVNRHKGEIKKDGRNYLYVNYINRGLGSASCGPQPEEEYELRPHSFRFVFMLKANDGEFENVEFDIKTQKLSDTYSAENVTKVKENFDCR